MRLDRLFLIVALVGTTTTAPAVAGDRPAATARAAGSELATDSGDAARVVLDPATGAARLVRIPSGALHLDGATTKARMTSFFGRYGGTFGITDSSRELDLTKSNTDRLGMTHLSYRQIYQGVPVFGAVLRGHFDRSGELVAVNGTFVPELRLNPSPTLPPIDAALAAAAVVAKEHTLRPTDFEIGTARLFVFRTGLARGVPGSNYLVWEVEVSALPQVREFVYVDAHNGTIVDRIAGIHDITRTVRHETFANRIWYEGDPLPFSDLTSAQNGEVNEIITASGETYDLYSNITGGDFLSYNGFDKTMTAIYEADFLNCPNASWNGQTTNFCNGFAVDDVVAHEWTHAYTDFNHDLIYQWQPGALNEAYSDIFGEIVDLLNGSGLDTPDRQRDANVCSTFAGVPVPTFAVTAPSSIAGNYDARGAEFNPDAPWSASGIVEQADDGTDTTSDGCESLVGFTSGRIALIDRGNCNFVDKAVNAADAGAAGVIIANNQGDAVIRMGGLRPSNFDTASVFVAQSTGDLIKSRLSDTVEVSMAVAEGGDESVRWLVAEARRGGAIRDMWSPNCFGDPAKVTDSFYFCAPDSSSDNDNGGVHINSGVPNHAFALLVDGGTFDGRQVNSIGMTKAAHIYWRAMSEYQTPYSKFADHADAIELSCEDLVGAALTRIETGGPSPQVINASDCEQVAAAMLAVEMREDPVQCGFEPILDPGPPPIEPPKTIFEENFDAPLDESWTLSNVGVYDEYDSRDWAWTDDLPAGREGGAFWAINSSFIGNCQPGDNDQSGVMFLESPPIGLPDTTTEAVLAFDHYVATEAGWDGGNVKISVNGGEYEIAPETAFLFNPYNSTLNPALGEEGNDNTNPLAGKSAYTGLDQGELAGSWGRSQIDLGALAVAGDVIRIRFDFGIDGCTGVEGWYIGSLEVSTNDPRTLSILRPSRRIKP